MVPNHVRYQLRYTSINIKWLHNFRAEGNCKNCEKHSRRFGTDKTAPNVSLFYTCYNLDTPYTIFSTAYVFYHTALILSIEIKTFYIIPLLIIPDKYATIRKKFRRYNMKRTITLLSVLAFIILVFASCGDSSANDTSKTSTLDFGGGVTEEAEIRQVELDNEVFLYASSEDFYSEATLKSVGIKTDDYGSYLLLTYDFTNLSDDDTGFHVLQYDFEIYQEGVALSPTSVEESKDEYSFIRPGATIEVVSAFVLRNTHSDIEICLYDQYRENVVEEYVIPIA